MVEIMETSLNPVLSLSLNRTVTKQINTIRWRDSLGRGSGAGQDPRQIELEMVMLIGKVWNRGWGVGVGDGAAVSLFLEKDCIDPLFFVFQVVFHVMHPSLHPITLLPPPPPPRTPLPLLPPPTPSIPPASTRAALAAPSAVLCERRGDDRTPEIALRLHCPPLMAASCQEVKFGFRCKKDYSATEITQRWSVDRPRRLCRPRLWLV